jgi:hypothetical protein
VLLHTEHDKKAENGWDVQTDKTELQDLICEKVIAL